MQLIEVIDKKSKKQFHKIPHILYKNDQNWASPIHGMVENIFDPKKNKTFKNGKAIRWVLVDENGKLLGRIAAFINFSLSKTYDQPTGGCGFFECIDNQEAANLLFNVAVDWNKKNGMEAMDGPINFGENFMNWGLLVDGFMPQGYGMPYNLKYYEKLFRTFGFKVYFEQYSFHVDYSAPVLDRFWKIAKWVAKKPDYTFKHLTFSELDKFIDDICTVYEAAWKSHEHFKPLDRDDLYDFIYDSKMIIDPEMIWFAYHENKPIAMFAMIPDINQILQKLNGKLNLWGIAKFLYYKKRKIINRTRILLMGIDENYQRYGIDSAIFWHQNEFMKSKPQYTDVELSWAGDFNPKIISLYNSVGGKKAKTHYTMRYLFDRNKPFKRAPIIE
ncbi:MAG: GNAT family N-acetyltransferase [Draconibacterium sp.]|nr:GNAT family N-acetyltransferase [Draconibacterium sp.]